MPEYEASQTVQASAEDVFAFVSDIKNMPQYLPTTHHAEPQGEGRVRVQGEAKGHQYDSDGWFRVDQSEYRMEWGSDGDTAYSGWLEIDETGDDACGVTVHLSFAPRPDQAQRMEQGEGGVDHKVQDGLNAALESIKNICEGKGAKVEPASAH